MAELENQNIDAEAEKQRELASENKKLKIIIGIGFALPSSIILFQGLTGASFRKFNIAYGAVGLIGSIIATVGAIKGAKSANLADNNVFGRTKNIFVEMYKNKQQRG